MVNWSLKDFVVRTQVNVGVAYGSDVELVFQKIEEAVAAQKEIHEKPKPEVLFVDFGDSALGFEVHFWLTARSPMERFTVESNLRRSIDKLFKEARLDISFPQRDVHLDTSSPHEIKLIKNSTEE